MLTRAILTRRLHTSAPARSGGDFWRMLDSSSSGDGGLKQRIKQGQQQQQQQQQQQGVKGATRVAANRNRQAPHANGQGGMSARPRPPLGLGGFATRPRPTPTARAPTNAPQDDRFAMVDAISDMAAALAPPPAAEADTKGPPGRGFHRRQPAKRHFEGAAAPRPADGSESSAAPERGFRGFSLPRGREQGTEAGAMPARRPRRKAAAGAPRTGSRTASDAPGLPEPLVFETYQPPTLASIDFSANPWARDVRNLPESRAVLTQEKVQRIREYLGGAYEHVDVKLPEPVREALTGPQHRIVCGALSTLNANVSYTHEVKANVAGTIVEALTGGKVKKAAIV